MEDKILFISFSVDYFSVCYHSEQMLLNPPIVLSQMSVTFDARRESGVPSKGSKQAGDNLLAKLRRFGL
jgi:hypothetical protein